MKFQAPPGVTALSCAGGDIVPDAQGFFEAAENLASDLLAHGCVPAPADAVPAPADAVPAPADAESSRAKNKDKRKAD